jgi:hypothetical protein
MNFFPRISTFFIHEFHEWNEFKILRIFYEFPLFSSTNFTNLTNFLILIEFHELKKPFGFFSNLRMIDNPVNPANPVNLVTNPIFNFQFSIILLQSAQPVCCR